jgi:hypothetical protein
MVQIAFAASHYGRRSTGLPEARLVNMFVEETPHGPAADARLPRPGLKAALSLGGGPIRGLFSQPGVFDGALFVVSGATAYLSNGTAIGTLGGDDNVRFAATGGQLVAVAGGKAYLYEGAGFSAITDSDLPEVCDVVAASGRFVYAVAGSDRFYWSEIGDAANIDGLSFATAEGAADPNLGIVALGDELYLMGAATTEFWYGAGDADLPFQRSAGRQFSRGCAARDAVAVIDNAVVFVGDDRIVYRAEETPRRISTFGIEERLKRCTAIGDALGQSVTVEGHAFYVLSIPGEGSFAFDVATGQWAEWQSFGRQLFRSRCALMRGGVAYLGDSESGTVWTLEPGVFQDGPDPMTFLASAFTPMPGGQLRCDNLVLQGARGVGLPAGQGALPQVEMRYSDDQGRTWSIWRGASLGRMGEYGRRAVWQRLGMIREPGRAFEVRTTDPVLATMSALLMNVKRPHG